MEDLVFYSPLDSSFEDAYLLARQKEGFVYSDEEVLLLPNLPISHPHGNIWKQRVARNNAFVSYIKKDSTLGHILELGCGNGWFSNQIAQATAAKVLGLDVNLMELDQANRVFQRENLSFAYGDFFTGEFLNQYDLIVLNASAQYFENLDLLINRAIELLAPTGELHILDTFFYENEKEQKEAKARSAQYYKKLEVEEMTEYYFHHSLESLAKFEVVESPQKKSRFGFGNKNESPFGWYKWKA